MALPGRMWSIGGHIVARGDARDPGLRRAVIAAVEATAMIVDPPFADPYPELPEIATMRSLVLTDNDYLATAIAAYGIPRAAYVWDCVSADRAVSNRPLRQMKLALWYGDFAEWDYCGDIWDRRVPYTERGETCQAAEVFRLQIAQLRKIGLPHQKPVDWIRRLLGCLTRGNAFDPYLGTGTTLIAAEQLGRRAGGIEMDEQLAALAVARIAAWLDAEPERLA